MNKQPQSFKEISFPNAQGQPMSPLDMTLQLGQKALEISHEKVDEIWAINVVSLFNSVLENI